MIKKILIVLSLLMLPFVACRQSKKNAPEPTPFFRKEFVHNNFRTGMTPDEVIALFGEPFINNSLDDSVTQFVYMQAVPPEGDYIFSGFTIYFENNLSTKITDIHSDVKY